MSDRRRAAALAALAALVAAPGHAAAQAPAEGEVRQLVTFSFLPGAAAEAVALFRDRALPLYERNEPMLTFRGFREVESPVPMDLLVVSAFEGMAGKDASNARLRELTAGSGASIGALYGAISDLSRGHTDEFVEMLPELGAGDPSTGRLTVFVRYRVAPGQGAAFERALAEAVVPWEAAAGRAAATGRFLVSDGWDYLRVLAFESLADFQAHRDALASSAAGAALGRVVAATRVTILAPLPELSVRE